MQLKPIARKSLSDAVFEQLSTEIVQGRMAPGAPLPSERALCAILGVNRGAVREALKRLSQAKLIAINHGEGATVLNFRQTAGLDMLACLLLRSDGTVDLKVARSLVEMRATMAPDIARLCARRCNREQVQQLSELTRQMPEHRENLAVVQQLVLEFWDVMVEGADNIAYRLAFNHLRQTYELIKDLLLEVLANELGDLHAYQTIALAVAQRDEKAAKDTAQQLIHLGTEGISQVLQALEQEAQKSINANREEANYGLLE